MINKYILILFVLCSISNLALSQKNSQNKESEIIYYNRDYFTIHGTTYPDSVKENPYHRLPNKHQDEVREIVWNLSKCSAGISIGFQTNSTSIHVKWSVRDSPIANRNHMAETGVKGVDLYFRNNRNWQYVNTARPNGNAFEEVLVENMVGKLREFRLFLPLYIELVDVQVGIDKNSVIKTGLKNPEKPIVFYGTSITQGGCASRPGMAHTNIISRKLDVECLNFGFRGNGNMEPEVAQILKAIEAKFYVIECLPNMTTEQVVQRTQTFVEIIRSVYKDTPVIFVENLMYENGCLDRGMVVMINEKNRALKNEYEKMRNNGVKNLYYIERTNALGNDHEATVDGIHLTDLGFLRYSEFLLKNFRNYSLI